MSYLKAYVEAVIKTASTFGLLYLLISYSQDRAWPLAAIYLSLMIGFAGPLSVWINKVENAK